MHPSSYWIWRDYAAACDFRIKPMFAPYLAAQENADDPHNFRDC